VKVSTPQHKRSVQLCRNRNVAKKAIRMWSFGNKREDQISQEAKMQNGPILRHPATTTTRAINGHRSDQNHQQPQQHLSPRGAGTLAAKSRMFYKNKKLSSANTVSSNANTNPKAGPGGQQPQKQSQQEAQNERSNSSRSKNLKRYFGGGGNNRNNNGSTNDDYLQDMSVSETSNGIEVSFPGSQLAKSKHSNLDSHRNPVISLKDQIRQRQSVYKSQFSAVLPSSTDVATAGALNNNNWRPKGHRIPLLGITPVGTAYTDTLHLLQTAPLVDEWTAVKQELVHLEKEISFLEQDRIWLEQSLKENNNSSSSRQLENRQQQTELITWDVHKLLKDDALKLKLLSVSERTKLQKQRGNSMTIHLNNTRTQEMFVHTCGGRPHNNQRTSLFKNDDTIITLMPNNCRSPHGAATTLLYLNLISDTKNLTGDAGLYFSRDDGKSQSIGQIPNRLHRRLEEQGSEGTAAGRHDIGDLLYLSTGPRGCYFAEFQSGECWWGSAVEDADFHNIMHSWDIYRVAFGPIESVEHDTQERQIPTAQPSENIHNNKAISTNSWIILSNDGRAAWKNLPSRLSNQLEERLANRAAPVEVSLGQGGSYFVRFLDGSIDYCLPAKVARVCERIEQRGGTITSISLHPDISHDFVIRHTELTR
jgi:hypothetical protein